MKIGFATDTNFLRGKKDLLYKKENFLGYSDYFINYIKSLEHTEIKNQLIYYMPQIVIDELYNQKIDAFYDRFNSLTNTYNDIKFALDGDLPKVKIESFLKEEIEKYKKNFKIIELEYTKEILKELVEESLKKKPPFDKSSEGQKTDAGFKDALIWKTILYTDAIDNCNKFYFFSSDKVFEEGAETLICEFKKRHPNIELKIVFYEPDGFQREKALEQLITENNLIRTNLVRLYDKSLLLDTIKTLTYKYYKDVSYKYDENTNLQLKKIDFEKFSQEDFSIENVEEENAFFDVVLNIKTKKYTFVQENIIENENNIVANLILTFNKIKKDFVLKKYELRNVKFKIPYNLNKIFSALIEYNYQIDRTAIKNMFKKLIENLDTTQERYKNNILGNYDYDYDYDIITIGNNDKIIEEKLEDNENNNENVDDSDK